MRTHVSNRGSTRATVTAKKNPAHQLQVKLTRGASGTEAALGRPVLDEDYVFQNSLRSVPISQNFEIFKYITKSLCFRLCP